MKQGRNLNELAREVSRQFNAKKDYQIRTTAVVAERNETGVGFAIPEINERFGVTNYAHGQIASFTGIPKKYYDQCYQDAPDLLVTNINHWLHKDESVQLMRTLDQNVRAWLSNKYRRMDNYDLCEVVLAELQKPNIKIESCEITDTKLYIKALNMDLTRTVTNVNDICTAGIVISNSEIGGSSLKVEPLVWRKVCTNGLIRSTALRKYHVGRAREEEALYSILSNEAITADERSLWLKVRDLTRTAIEDVATFERVIESLRQSNEIPLNEKEPEKVVQEVGDYFVLNVDERKGIMRHLLEGGSYTQFGMINAITRTAQDVESYDRATELERIGGNILDVSDSEWRRWNEPSKN